MAREPVFLTALTAGRLPWKAYADLVAQHFFLYESLEQAAGAMAYDPVAGAFVLPELARVPALAADLSFLRGAGWQAQITALPSTTTYCTRLREAAFHRPHGFIAHYCTRHIDDLSAGYRLAPAAVSWYGLDSLGRLFLTCEGIAVDDLRAHFDRVFDRVPWPPAEEAAFLAEIGYARQLYAAVLDDLARRWV